MVFPRAAMWLTCLWAHASALFSRANTPRAGSQRTELGWPRGRQVGVTACADTESISLRSWVGLILPLWRTPVIFLPRASHTQAMELSMLKKKTEREDQGSN